MRIGTTQTHSALAGMASKTVIGSTTQRFGMEVALSTVLKLAKVHTV